MKAVAKEANNLRRGLAPLESELQKAELEYIILSKSRPDDDEEVGRLAKRIEELRQAVRNGKRIDENNKEYIREEERTQEIVKESEEILPRIIE